MERWSNLTNIVTNSQNPFQTCNYSQQQVRKMPSAFLEKIVQIKKFGYFSYQSEAGKEGTSQTRKR
jgi:hypothetical protein